MDSYELNTLVDAINGLRAEQQRTNQLLADLLQSNLALIEALGEPEQEAEPEYDLDGNRRSVGGSQSAYMDMP